MCSAKTRAGTLLLRLPLPTGIAFPVSTCRRGTRIHERACAPEALGDSHLCSPVDPLKPTAYSLHNTQYTIHNTPSIPRPLNAAP
jgi:hypothetical protein